MSSWRGQRGLVGDGDAVADTDARDGAAAPALAASKQTWERARGATALGTTWGTAVSQGPRAARQLATDETLLRELQRKATQVHEALGLLDHAQARMAELLQLAEGGDSAGAAAGGRAAMRLQEAAGDIGEELALATQRLAELGKAPGCGETAVPYLER